MFWSLSILVFQCFSISVFSCFTFNFLIYILIYSTFQVIILFNFLYFCIVLNKCQSESFYLDFLDFFGFFWIKIGSLWIVIS